MFTLKHLKTLQHVSHLIQIIFRELICPLSKLLMLKFVKNVKVNVVVRQHYIWCVCVRAFCVEMCAGLRLDGRIIQGGSNMAGTDLCVNKPHCVAAVRP